MHTNASEQSIEASATRAEEAADAVVSSLEDAKNTIMLLTPSLDATQQCINGLFTRATEGTSPTNPTTLTSPTLYSDAVKSTGATTPPAPVSAALARVAIRKRQILIDSQTAKQPLHTENQSTQEIVDKLMNTINVAKPRDAPIIDIRAIMCLKNRGLILELNSSQAANWLKQGANKRNFLEALETPAELKD
ncbi:hypothetical protein PAXINDRAFT_16583 [Paxillus involutus ATCC 200175]|uniref:Uncharacterized protein n=1 Tax=Paxillus involutus ATCC 200175 TaxID=664439 RepID=A0A0C9T451_PAXIN|nr:hypothetical protein PAXINDRAFT_16583 [Paxillus involutus ATCC 200175]